MIGSADLSQVRALLLQVPATLFHYAMHLRLSHISVKEVFARLSALDIPYRHTTASLGVISMACRVHGFASE